MKKRKTCELNGNENDVLDLPSLEIVIFEAWSFQYCHVAVFESMWWLFIFISFLILDLPKLHTISFNGSGQQALRGDNGYNSQTMINGHFGHDCFKYADCSLKGEWNERKNEMWFEWIC